MSTIAFALRADFADDFDGGSVNVSPDGHALNVAEALAAGNGSIVTDESDSLIVAQLDTYPALKRVPADGATATVRRYDFMDAEAIHHEASRRSILGPIGSASAEKLRTALIQQDALIADGDLGAANEVSVSDAAPAASKPSAAKAKGSTTTDGADGAEG